MDKLVVLGWYTAPFPGAEPMIVITLDGVGWQVPDDPRNPMRALVAEWEAEGNTIPASYTPPPDSLEVPHGPA